MPELPHLIGSALDLSGYTGAAIPVQLQPDLIALAFFLLIAAAALVTETRALRHRGVTAGAHSPLGSEQVDRDLPQLGRLAGVDCVRGHATTDTGPGGLSLLAVFEVAAGDAVDQRRGGEQH